MTTLTVTKYETVEPGEYIAKVAKLETVSGEYGEQLKVSFELAEQPGVLVTGWASLKLSPKAKLYKWASALCFGGADFEGDFDLDNLMGRACRLILALETGKDGQEHNKIVDVFPPRRGVRPAPASTVATPRPGPVAVNASAVPAGPEKVPDWLDGNEVPF